MVEQSEVWWVKFEVDYEVVHIETLYASHSHLKPHRRAPSTAIPASAAGLARTLHMAASNP